MSEPLFNKLPEPLSKPMTAAASQAMTRVRGETVTAFSPDWLGPAQALLWQQHRPGPAQATRAELDQALEALAGDGIGAVSHCGGSLTGFLLARTHADRFYGVSAQVPLWGQAAASPDSLRRLYARASGDWVARGALKHQIQLAIDDEAGIGAFFELGFGREQVHALLPLVEPLSQAEPPPRKGAPVIRLGAEGDLGLLTPLLPLILASYAQGPVWEPFLPAQVETLSAAYASLLADADYRLWLAEADGRALAFQLYGPAEPDPMTPERCMGLLTAATAPEARGEGWQRRLLQTAAAAFAEVTWLQADWRSTSLTAAATWPALGFRPTVLRLARRLPQAFARA